MTKEQFYKQRNDALKTDLPDCDIIIDKKGTVCNYHPINYMDFVDHREDVHKIKRGKADKYNG